MLVAFDTNILVYAEGLNDPQREARAKELRSRLGPKRVFLASQVVGEFYNVLTRKYRTPLDRARSICREWISTCASGAATEATFAHATDLATEAGLQIWDAVILVTAADAKCAALLSEDMQHGFVYRGVTVINPFAEPPHPLLADALRHHR
jgi:predicted nucleic acid-binding protein